MSRSCRNDCVETLFFPKNVVNRPGLSHIDYRMGTYSDFREALLRRLNTDPILSSWTHRKADDPGIALLEGASILGDILTFYQELYANEAYLRTAQWRESIADLVRLVGYRLSPGLGGKAKFGFVVRGDKPVVIPKGFPIKAQVEGAERPVDFETKEETIAIPSLSKFNLYRPRRAPQMITAGLNRLEIQSVNGSSDIASISAIDIKAGDRIMLVPDATMFDVTGTPYTTQKKAEILIVSEVQRILDRSIITFEGALTDNRGAQVTAYRIGRSFRHFGHNTPAQLTKYDNSTKSVTQEATKFERAIWDTHTPPSADADYYSTLLKTEMPLDQEVDDLAQGGKLVCQGWTVFTGQSTAVPFTVVKEIKNVRSDSLVWGNLSGPSTVVTIDAKLIANNSILNEKSDIRKLSFHEVLGPQMTLRAPTAWNDGPFVSKMLNYFGTYAEALVLASRELLLERQDEVIQSVTVTSKSSDFLLTGKDKTKQWLWPVRLDQKLEPFVQEDFDEQTPKVTIYGNLVEAPQGKTEKEDILGNGDSRQTFQTFKLPKAPLTYHNSPGETPPEVPELQIYVNDRLWKRVPSLFGRGSKEEIYIVREDAKGESWVQFGDGKTGARLPSGVRNVVAKYRTGTGAYGALKEETTVQPGGKLNRLNKIQLPGIVTGGSDPETGDNAREAAPGKIQSLGRIVSLKDFESEALAISGVSKVTASWDLLDNVPSVVLTVLMETGRDEEFGEVQKTLTRYNRCRGMQRFPIDVQPGKRLYVYVDAIYGHHPAFREDVVEKAIKKALGVEGDEGNGIDGSRGLFGIHQRRFGYSEYATRIAGTIQNVEGVMWAEIKALGFSLGSSDKPSELNLPPEPKPLNSVVSCDNLHILSLFRDHLQISASKVQSTEEC